MADDIFKWIRNASALNDEQLKQEIDLVHQSSIKAFARALAKVRRPYVDTHTLRNGTLTEHNFADTINLLLSIGEQTVTAINSNVPVSPFPYNDSTHMYVDSRIKVLTRRITVHKSEIPSGRDTSSQATHLQLRQFIGQDLAALELCFDQKDFNDYTTQHFNWKYAMCHLYIVYYRILNDYPMFVYSGLPDNNSQRMHKVRLGWKVTKQKHCIQIIFHRAHSGRELCRHIVKPLTLMTTQSPHETVSIQLKMIKRRTAINPLKTT